MVIWQFSELIFGFLFGIIAVLIVYAVNRAVQGFDSFNTTKRGKHRKR